MAHRSIGLDLRYRRKVTGAVSARRHLRRGDEGQPRPDQGRKYCGKKTEIRREWIRSAVLLTIVAATSEGRRRVGVDLGRFVGIGYWTCSLERPVAIIKLKPTIQRGRIDEGKRHVPVDPRCPGGADYGTCQHAGQDYRDTETHPEVRPDR